MIIITNYASRDTRSYELIYKIYQINPVGIRFGSKFEKYMIPTIAVIETPTIAVIEMDVTINLDMLET